MPAGRPRTVSLPPEEMIELGKEMVKWVEENDPLHLSEWYTIEKLYTYNEWDTFNKKPEFVPYYEKALKLIGRKYLDKKSDVRDNISQRWLRIYFKDLKEMEDEKVKHDAEVKAEALVKNVSNLTLTDLMEKLSDDKVKQR